MSDTTWQPPGIRSETDIVVVCSCWAVVCRNLAEDIWRVADPQDSPVVLVLSEGFLKRRLSRELRELKHSCGQKLE